MLMLAVQLISWFVAGHQRVQSAETECGLLNCSGLEQAEKEAAGRPCPTPGVGPSARGSAVGAEN